MSVRKNLTMFWHHGRPIAWWNACQTCWSPAGHWWHWWWHGPYGVRSWKTHFLHGTANGWSGNGPLSKAMARLFLGTLVATPFAMYVVLFVKCWIGHRWGPAVPTGLFLVGYVSIVWFLATKVVQSRRETKQTEAKRMEELL